MHSQYLATWEHNKFLKERLQDFRGKVLDVGCGSKPYEFYTNAEKYIGVDIIIDSPKVDAKMEEGKFIPFKTNYFDNIISTQALEHIEDLDVVMSEIKRVAKPDAKILISLPFMFHQHGSPYDYRRLTKFGLIKYYVEKFEFEYLEIKTFGGIGTYLVVGFQDWIESLEGKIFLLFKILLLHVYFLYTPMLNLAGVILNKIDTTDSFYSNIAILAKNKK